MKWYMILFHMLVTLYFQCLSSSLYLILTGTLDTMIQNLLPLVFMLIC